jgi:type VI protein secretion system component Hcp
MSDEIKKLEDETPKAEPSAELSEPVLDEVVGGKTALQDMHFTKVIDKSSPNLF